MRTGRLTVLGSLVPLALVASACSSSGKLVATSSTAASGGSSTSAASASSSTTAASTTTAAATTTTAAKPSSVTIRPLFVQGTSGGVGTEKVSVAPASDGALRMSFSEDEVSGLGDQSRAASWSAVTVATLLSGAPLSGEYKFEIQGPIDGPSAGALKTVAVLSLMRGDTLQTDITMTGTINPDGTLGPVGGIPEKIKGAAAQGFKRVLIPVGQRNTPSEADKQLVDVVAEGKTLGVDVSEVTDVYEAYSQFTGKQLPKLQSTGSPKLSDTAYTRLKAKADEFGAKFTAGANAFNTLDPSIQQLLVSVTSLANEASTRSKDLETQGLQAGAFSKAAEASAYANAAVSAGQAIQILLTQGIDPFLSRVGQSQAIQDQVYAELDLLKTFDPKTLSDASVLTSTYAQAIDALAIGTFASNQINAIGKQVSSGAITVDTAVPQLLIPVVYFELAGVVLDEAKAEFDIGRDLGGPAITAGASVPGIADFFRKGGDANFAALQSNVIKSYANQLNQSEDGMLARFANVDTDIALALSERSLVAGLTKYIGDGVPNAQYAMLGFAINNYARTATLLEKYYSNGVLDDQLNLTGVRSEAALSGGLDLAKSQLAASIGLLSSKKVDATMQVGSYEVASVEREGKVDEKFQALTDYWNGLVSSRVLAYLGGFPTDGLKG